MKEKKRKEIIESAIKLFAEKGFYNTTVQDIVTDSGISKGAFYNYFSSKEELHIAIFQYYFEQMSAKSQEIDEKNLPPREKMREKLRVPFEQFYKQKEFFMVYMREQGFSINKELRKFMEKTQYETLSWYERNLKEIYGEKVTAYTADIILFIEGMRNSYLVAMLFHGLQIDGTLLSKFLMNRIDDIVAAFEKGEEPIIKTDSLLTSCYSFGKVNMREKASSLLADMLEQMEIININKEQKDGLSNVIQFLTNELQKPKLDKYAFQGMLANLKEIKEFDIYREKIANLLDVQLL